MSNTSGPEPAHYGKPQQCGERHSGLLRKLGPLGPRGFTFQVNDPSSFGAAIKDFRTVRHLSQAELAEAVGVHRSYLSGMEQGRFTEQLSRLFAIFRHLGVAVTLTLEDVVDDGTQ